MVLHLVAHPCLLYLIYLFFGAFGESLILKSLFSSTVKDQEIHLPKVMFWILYARFGWFCVSLKKMKKSCSKNSSKSCHSQSKPSKLSGISKRSKATQLKTSRKGSKNIRAQTLALDGSLQQVLAELSTKQGTKTLKNISNRSDASQLKSKSPLSQKDLDLTLDLFSNL